ncbi:hypothetical protein TNCV_959701 [Trichonephila clavipes]|nr:hypothetical protein TNCV_959701 [Trichonephila clavipes]
MHITDIDNLMINPFLDEDDHNISNNNCEDKGTWWQSSFRAPRTLPPCNAGVAGVYVTPLDADSGHENQMNTAAPVPSSSEKRIIKNSMRSYLDVHSDYDMTKKIDDNEQFVDNSILKKTMQRKIPDYCPKAQ